MKPVKLGQHFLADKTIVKEIVRLARLKPGDTVIEIGGGHGELTQPIAEKRGIKVITIEKDFELCKKLRKKFNGFGNITVIENDFLKMDIRALINEESANSDRMKIIGNLPYYITTPILMKLFSEKDLFSRLVITVQREVADRMAAAPGNKTYGALSLAVQYHAEVEALVPVGKEAFRPQPEVNSAIVSLRLRDKPPVKLLDEKSFFIFTRKAFSQRRKMLHNTLMRITCLEKNEVIKLLSAININHESRPENISLKQFAELFSLIGADTDENHNRSR